MMATRRMWLPHVRRRLDWAVTLLQRHAHKGAGAYVIDAELSLDDHVIQVYGANTDVGKTVVCGGLGQAALKRGLRSSYIKPVQTGDNSDSAFFQKHVGNGTSHTLFSYTKPVSPHIAASLDGQTTTDAELLDALIQKITDCFSTSSAVPGSTSSGSLTLVECAGGVLSPGPSGALQADLYRPLRLPVLLVGDGRLGGISATLSALESLRLRGYTVVGVAFIEQEEDLGNADLVEQRLKHDGPRFEEIPVFRLDPLPKDPQESLDGWYRENEGALAGALETMLQFRRSRLADAMGFAEAAARRFWWPFTQHRNVDPSNITVVDSAYGDYYHTFKIREEPHDGTKRHRRRAMLDSCASWWTQGVGHGDPGMSLAIAEAAGRYGHVMFPDNVHEPALRLAEELLTEGPGKGWAHKCFFSDDGSTATELAIKMGFRQFLRTKLGSSSLPEGLRLSLVALEDCYHGDTLGAMDASAPSAFNTGQHNWYEPRGLFLKPPTLSWRKGEFSVKLPKVLQGQATERDLIFASRDDAFRLELRETGKLAAAYRTYVHWAMDDHQATTGTMLASLMLEPVVMGAGGMVFVDPLFHRVLAQECRKRGLPVIYDEVFAGCWRLGVESSRELLGVDPDIGCYAKLLSGGVVPMAVTLASQEVFQAFEGDTKAEALLHGHSYTAHPVGCAASLYALRRYRESPHFRGRGRRMADMWDEEAVARISRLKNVRRAFSLGSAFAVELEVKAGGTGYYASHASQAVIKALRGAGLHNRALGNVVYVMMSPMTAAEECDRVIHVMEDILTKASIGELESVTTGHDNLV